MGRLQPNSGDIRIFGSQPGSHECNIPGPGVGYMPQDLGLYLNLKIDELLAYFGKIYSMNETEITERITEMTKLLNIPTNKKLICNYMQFTL